MEVKSYQDLVVWQKSRALGKEIRKITRKLPKEEQYALADQMRRAADSIPSNIAEGHERGTTKEFINFLAIARGSNAELQTQMLLCVEYEYVFQDDVAVALGLTEEVMRMLHKLIQSLQRWR